jgi:hypothetical protein
MSASPAALPLRDVERELSRQLEGARQHDEGPAQRAHMSNLVIYCDRADTAASLANTVPAVVEAHPARVLVLVGESAGASNEIEGERPRRAPSNRSRKSWSSTARTPSFKRCCSRAG